jgi:hypothetical protein
MKNHSFEDKVLPMMYMRQVLSVVQKDGGALVQTCVVGERQRVYWGRPQILNNWGPGRRPVTGHRIT